MLQVPKNQLIVPKPQLNIPKTNPINQIQPQPPIRHSTIINIQQANEQRPQYIYSDKMTLKQYLQQKNIQRSIEFKALNMVRSGANFNPLSSQNEYMFEKQVMDIKGFVKSVMGEGSLYNRFLIMLDNLYSMFLREITVYYKLRVNREQTEEDQRIKEFRDVNNKLTDYLKSCEDESRKVEDRLEHMKRTKEFYQKQREKRLAEMKQKIQNEKRDAQRKQQQRIETEKQAKQEQERKRKQDQESRAKNLKNELFAGKKIQRPDLKNLQQIQEYKKRKDNIGKLSNIFASMVGGK